MNWITGCNKKSSCCSPNYLQQIYSLLCTFFTALKRRFLEGTENFSNYANINPTGIVVSSLPVRIEDWEIFNSHTVPQWVRLYNKGDTLPTAADDTALVDGLPVLIKRLLVPALSGENLADLNIHFTKGLSIRGTLSQADGSNDAPVAPITVNIGYKKL